MEGGEKALLKVLTERLKERCVKYKNVKTKYIELLKKFNRFRNEKCQSDKDIEKLKERNAYLEKLNRSLLDSNEKFRRDLLEYQSKLYRKTLPDPCKDKRGENLKNNPRLIAEPRKSWTEGEKRPSSNLRCSDNLLHLDIINSSMLDLGSASIDIDLEIDDPINTDIILSTSENIVEELNLLKESISDSTLRY